MSDIVDRLRSYEGRIVVDLGEHHQPGGRTTVFVPELDIAADEINRLRKENVELWESGLRRADAHQQAGTDLAVDRSVSCLFANSRKGAFASVIGRWGGRVAMTSLPDIITEIEALEGPSREMDARIGAWLLNTQLEERGLDYRATANGDQIRIGSAEPLEAYDRYTASIDAAVALAELVLPEWDWTIQNHGAACVYRYEPKWDEFWEHECEDAANPATALVVAALRALAAKQTDA